MMFTRLTLVFALFITLPRLANGDPIYVETYQPPTVDRVNGPGDVLQIASGFNLLESDAITVAGNGNVYVGGQSAIYQITPQGSVSVFASNNVSAPAALTFDTSGNLYVANEGNNTIEKFNTQGQGTLFGHTVLQPTGGMAFDTNGNLYVAIDGNSTVEKFDPSGHESTFASINSPYSLAYHNGFIYVGNAGNQIFKFDLNGNETLFTGTGLNGPQGMAFDSSGNLFVENINNGQISEYDSQGHYSLYTTVPFLNGIAVQPVPEPTTCLLGTISGILILAANRKRRAA